MTDRVHQISRALPLATPAELEFWSGRGSVTMLPLRVGEEPSVEVAGRFAAGRDVSVERTRNIVRVEVERDGGSIRGSDRDQCQIVLRVPRAIRAQIHADAGSIEVRDLGPCALDVETGAGRIALFDVYGQLRLSTGAGQIAGRGIGGKIFTETNAGAILLEINRLDPGDHYIHARAGVIRLDLARNLNARVEISSRRGEVHTDYPVRSIAAAVLRVSTDVGSIHVHGIHASALPRFPSEDLPPQPVPPLDDQAEYDHRPDESRPTTPPMSSSELAAAREAELERIMTLIQSGVFSIQDVKAVLKAVRVREDGDDE
jgi:hypothetical protein